MNEQCPICLEIIDHESLCKTSCNHFFCSDCLEQLIDNKKISCPLCRGVIKKYENQNNIHHIIAIENQRNTENNVDIIDLTNQYYNSRKKYLCMGMFLFSYILYVYCSNHLRILDYNLLSEQYHNCSLELSNIKSDHLEQITVCGNEYFKICSFPQYFVNKCLEYATK
jgi:hypothetical protein